MTTRAVMKARIANELARDDLETEIGEQIASAIAHYQFRRFWFNQDEVATFSTEDGTEFYDLPTPFLSIDHVKASDGSARWSLDETQNSLVREWQSGTITNSRPSVWTQAQGQLRLWPVPDGVYTITVAGLIDRMPASDSETDNPWMTYAESLIRSRAKALVRIEILRAPAAIAEAANLRAAREDFLSLIEAATFRNLAQQTRKRTNTGRVRPSSY